MFVLKVRKGAKGSHSWTRVDYLYLSFSEASKARAAFESDGFEVRIKKL